jgi:hypothetical protein
MTRYLLYFLTGFAHALVILFYRGYLGEAPTFNSSLALISGMVLFSIVSWLKLFIEKAGAIIAIICILALLPWTIEAGNKVLEMEAFLSGVMLITHAVLLVLIIASLITSLRYIFSQRPWFGGSSRPGLIGKIFAALIPIALLIAWLFIMHKV